MDHHHILILKEVLERIALTGVAIKGQNHELLEKFILQYALRERRVGCIGGDGSESAMIWHYNAPILRVRRRYCDVYT